MTSALNPINSALIATGLVPIAHALGTSVGQTAILVSALYLASAIAQPTAGKLSEVLGPRRVYLVGTALVLVGGIIGGFGSDLTTLTVARVLIGIGTSAGYPAAMVIIRRRASLEGMNEPPGNVLGGLSIAGTATVAVGPPIGGVLLAMFGWRSAFFVNLPVTILVLLMTLAWVPKDDRFERRPLGEIARRVDASGIVLFGGMMSALLVFLLSLPSPAWLPLGIFLALGIVLVWWELRASSPFIDMRLLASNMALTRTYLRGALTLLAFYTVLFGLTQWLEAGHGLSTQAAGLMLLPMGVLGAIVARPVAARNLVRGPLVLGAASLVVASGAVALFTSTTPLVAIIGVTLLFAVTLGTTTVSNQTALYVQAPAEQVGTAAGLFRTFGYLGSIASATITGTVFRHDVTDSGLHVTAAILAGVSIVVLALTVLDRSLAKRQTFPKATVTEPQDASHNQLAPTDKYEMFVQVLTRKVTRDEAAEKWGVDQSTVVSICRTAKEGALDALDPTRQPTQRAELDTITTALEAARAEIELLQATVTEQALAFDARRD
ncbi:MFS transporter [Nocardia jiangxiensis]|uniref:MFS transporter n=1 Tax=Nocardia jiangxiensis TaxID=282685 RepID=UPI0007C44D3D|nr:MFS transporter [Nocardia jiangxiensis]